MLVAIRVTLQMIVRFEPSSNGDRDLNIQCSSAPEPLDSKRALISIQVSSGLKVSARAALRQLDKIRAWTIYNCCEALLPVLVTTKQISTQPSGAARCPVLLAGVIKTFPRLVDVLRPDRAEGHGVTSVQPTVALDDDAAVVLRRALVLNLRNYARERQRRQLEYELLEVQSFLSPSLLLAPNPIDHCLGVTTPERPQLIASRTLAVEAFCKRHSILPDEDAVNRYLRDSSAQPSRGTSASMATTARVRQRGDAFEGLDSSSESDDEISTEPAAASGTIRQHEVENALLAEIQRYATHCTTPGQVHSSDRKDFLLHWRRRQDEFPTLARLARMVFLVEATSVADERSFSRNRGIIGLFRESLDPVTLEWLAMGKLYWHMLKGVNVHQLVLQQKWKTTDHPTDIICHIAGVDKRWCPVMNSEYKSLHSATWESGEQAGGGTPE